MGTKVKVFGGYPRGKFRTVVAASSKKAGAMIVGCSLNHFNNYWTESFNKTELDVALSEPGVVFELVNGSWKAKR